MKTIILRNDQSLHFCPRDPGQKKGVNSAMFSSCLVWGNTGLLCISCESEGHPATWLCASRKIRLSATVTNTWDPQFKGGKIYFGHGFRGVREDSEEGRDRTRTRYSSKVNPQWPSTPNHIFTSSPKCHQIMNPSLINSLMKGELCPIHFSIVPPG
jgi:hypothetical protein